MSKHEIVDIADIELDPENAREHDDQNIEAIKGSLEAFGPGRSIVLDGGNTIRAGNGTIEAARAAGFDKVMVVEPEAKTLVAVRRPDWSEQEAKGYGVADNRAAELAKWNMPALKDIIDSTPDIDLGAMGFSQEQFDALCDTGERSGSDIDGIGDDDIPEPPADPVTKLGDVWSLGRHVLLCGDSSILVPPVEKLMGGKANAVITDPPYGVSYVGKTKDALTIQNDDESADLPGLLRGAFENCIAVTEPGAAWYVSAPPGPAFLVFAQILNGLMVWRQTLAWVKDSMVLGHSDYHYKHEPIFYGWTPGGAHRPPRTRDKTTVWEFPRPKRSAEHPTMKPVALFANAMNDTVPYKGVVFDPFLGSGTTLIAAEEMEMRCLGIELDPRYCDVVVERWENLTGSKAKRVSA